MANPRAIWAILPKLLERFDSVVDTGSWEIRNVIQIAAPISRRFPPVTPSETRRCIQDSSVATIFDNPCLSCAIGSVVFHITCLLLGRQLGP